jgi:hypothetical protein
MARVRLHALASLREALLAFDGEPAAEETQVPFCKQSQAEGAKSTFSLEEFNQSVKALAISNTYVPNVQLLKAMADGKTIKIDLEANVDQAVTIVEPVK